MSVRLRHVHWRWLLPLGIAALAVGLGVGLTNGGGGTRLSSTTNNAAQEHVGVAIPAPSAIVRSAVEGLLGLRSFHAAGRVFREGELSQQRALDNLGKLIRRQVTLTAGDFSTPDTLRVTRSALPEEFLAGRDWRVDTEAEPPPEVRIAVREGRVEEPYPPTIGASAWSDDPKSLLAEFLTQLMKARGTSQSLDLMLKFRSVAAIDDPGILEPGLKGYEAIYGVGVFARETWRFWINPADGLVRKIEWTDRVEEGGPGKQYGYPSRQMGEIMLSGFNDEPSSEQAAASAFAR